MTTPVRRRCLGPGSWDGIELLQYKADDRTAFRAVSRQVLFDDAALAAQLRYFQVEPGGWSTLERHEHVHAVMVLCGRGRCLVGREAFDVAEHDLVNVPAMTWHQFRAASDAPLGFLCLVNRERDRPQEPSDEELAGLRSDAAVAAFLDGDPT